MTQRNKLWVALVCMSCLAVSVGGARGAGVADLVAKMPLKDSASGQAVMAEIVKMGPHAVREVCGMLKAPTEDGNRAKAEFTVHGLAMYCSRPGEGAERVMLEGVLLEALASDKRPAVRAFLIRQIQLVGQDASVAPLAALLLDKRLGEPATQALLRIGTAEAKQALATALSKADQGPRRVTLVRAVGQARITAAAKAVAALADDKNDVLRRLAWWALANMGDAAAADKVTQALTHNDTYEKSQALKYYLLLASRLAQAGDKAAAAKMCRSLIAKDIPSRGNNAICGGLAVLVDVEGAGAMPELLAAADHKDKRVREAALRLAREIPGEAITKQWIAKARSAAPVVRAEIVTMLAYRGDLAGAPTVVAAMSDADKGVRQAAIKAVAQFGAKVAVGPLLDAMDSKDADDVKAARATLAWVRGEGFGAAVAGRLGKASPDGKAALIGLLASRGATDQAEVVFSAASDKDATVALAATKALESLASPKDIERVLGLMLTTTGSQQSAARKVVVTLCTRGTLGAAPLLAGMKRADGAARMALHKALASLGGADALAAVLADTKSTNADLKDSAIRALASWPDAGAAGELLQIAKATDNKVHHVLALRGGVRLAGAMPADKAVGMLGDAMSAARDDADKRLVLGGLGQVRSDAALKVLVGFLDDEKFREEAAAAVVRVVTPQRRGDRGLRTPAAKAALQKVVEVSKNRGVTDKARQFLQQAFKVRAAGPPPDPNILSLGRPVKTNVAQQGDNSPDQAVDGVLTNDSAWFGARWPCWLQVDLEKSALIDTVRPVFYSDGRFYQYTVEISADGKTWTKVVDNSGNTRPATLTGQTHRFAPVQARFVRLNVLKNSANEAVHVVEFEVYAAGKAPKTLKTTRAVAANGAPKATPAPAPATPAVPPLGTPDADGFISLFNGKDLTGWIGSTKGYVVEDGLLVCLKKGGGNLYTAREFGDFILQFDFKLTKGANNGCGIRAPATGNAAYAGMELQIIDTPGWPGKLRPYQVHGSIYGVVPAKTGHLKPVGEWNHQEVRAVGPRITVILNGATIVDADLNKVEKFADGSNAKHHPGIFRRSGHIGWLGHGARVAWKNIKVKPLEPYTEGPHNVPPKGFKALFNGKDLTGWKGLVGNPKTRAAMKPDQLAAAGAKADQKVKEHWKIVDGSLVYDGKGTSLCTAKDYGDFEMYVDWKIHPGGDSGIYLRGSPQVQIWQRPEGSGGLYNNQKKENPSKPLWCSDYPPGQWNRFRIKMIGQRVSVWLNGVLVVDNTVMENYWDRSIPIYPKGQIELQHHGSHLWFRNIYIREIPPGESMK